jgi:ABC-type taurine transport system substrate-binding protein
VTWEKVQGHAKTAPKGARKEGEHMKGFLRLLAIGFASLAALPASAAEKITLLYVPINAYVASYAAKDQGFFARYGLDIELKIVPTGGPSIASLMAGSAQIAGTTPTQFLQANEQGFDLVIVGGAVAYPVTPNANGIVAKTGSGIKAPADLIGKKVGIPGLGSTQEILPKAWLRANGIDERKVDWIEIQFPQLVDALKSGLVDAEVSVSPFLSRAVERASVISSWTSMPSRRAERWGLFSLGHEAGQTRTGPPCKPSGRPWSRRRISQPMRRTARRCSASSPNTRSCRRRSPPPSRCRSV